MHELYMKELLNNTFWDRKEGFILCLVKDTITRLHFPRKPVNLIIYVKNSYELNFLIDHPCKLCLENFKV